MNKEELLQIVGGISITGTLLTSIYKVGIFVLDTGRSLGSAIRRISGGSMCSI